MRIPAGVHRLGPENATLVVKTGRTGAAAKAGHDLVFHVTAWTAMLEVTEGPAPTSMALEADAASLRVRHGTGGMRALADGDKASIHESIDEDVLRRKPIEFRSTRVRSSGTGDRISVQGELELDGTVRPITFDLAVGDEGRLSGGLTLRQTDWGIKPYSTLFGALKVVDEVEVAIDARLPRG